MKMGEKNPDNLLENETEESELDPFSESFNPVRALNQPDYKICNRTPKVSYQNLAAFESALKKVGPFNLNKPSLNEPSTSKKAATRSVAQQEEDTHQRRFLPEQMPVKGGQRQRHQRNLLTYTANLTTGPLALLSQYVREKIRVKVLTRKEHGVRGYLEGSLVAFDKHWNLLLRDVYDVWRRRKFAFGENKICGDPEDCSERLKRLGIELPKLEVVSLNRKNVEVRAFRPQLMIRGEQVVLITRAKPNQETQDTTEA